MPEEPRDREIEEPTTYIPKGLRVPVPKRGDFFHNLAKVAKPRRKGEREDKPED